MNRFPALLFLLVCAAAATAFNHAAHAASLEPQNYHRAFAALDAGHADQAYAVTTKAHDAALNKVLLGYYLAAPGNAGSFAETMNFLRENPVWPNLRDIRMIAEQKIPYDATPTQIVSWFSAYPPVTLIGFYRFIDALNANGQSQVAASFIRKRWVDGDFREDELTAFYTRFGAVLSGDDHSARLDRLLWNNDANGARRMYGLVDNNVRDLAEARLALSGQKFDAPLRLSHVSGEWQSDTGLLYERLRWLRRNNRDADAIDILMHSPSDLGRPEAWWEERQIMIRRSMDNRDFELAYRLADNHGQTDGISLVQAEFLAGWLALRFLNQPSTAEEHFQALCDHATTPISRARGAYWLGRAQEAQNDRNGAEQSYEAAAVLNTTFYGQLAAARLYEQPIISAMPEPTIPAAVRDRFYHRDIVRAIERLHDIGENTRMQTFFKTVVDTSTQRTDFVLLTELAYQLQRPSMAIEAAKAANQKNMLVAAGGFPVIEHNVPKTPEPAFTYALIRQESMFNPDAASPAGAHGLMQLMPATAKSMAQKIGVKFRQQKLREPDYNLRLGTAFVQNQINSFDGSYILALAAYNAGPSRVREWMEQIGDPRSPRVDPVDWIELIPVPETRNYVQRILENLQVYRARLNGGKAPLLILKDLKR